MALCFRTHTHAHTQSQSHKNTVKLKLNWRQLSIQASFVFCKARQWISQVLQRVLFHPRTLSHFSFIDARTRTFCLPKYRLSVELCRRRKKKTTELWDNVMWSFQGIQVLWASSKKWNIWTEESDGILQLFPVRFLRVSSSNPYQATTWLDACLPVTFLPLLTASSSSVRPRSSSLLPSSKLSRV